MRADENLTQGSRSERTAKLNLPNYLHSNASFQCEYVMLNSESNKTLKKAQARKRPSVFKSMPPEIKTGKTGATYLPCSGNQR